MNNTLIGLCNRTFVERLVNKNRLWMNEKPAGYNQKKEASISKVYSPIKRESKFINVFNWSEMYVIMDGFPLRHIKKIGKIKIYCIFHRLSIWACFQRYNLCGSLTNFLRFSILFNRGFKFTSCRILRVRFWRSLMVSYTYDTREAKYV